MIETAAKDVHRRHRIGFSAAVLLGFAFLCHMAPPFPGAMAEDKAAVRAKEILLLHESCSRHKAERRYAAASRHMDERRYAAALACYREVRKRDPGHADAQAKVTDLETVVAWKEAEKKKTVEGYYRFLQVNQDPLFADFARRRLHKLEPNYWREVVLKKKTKAAYLRYLEIYPKGKFIDSAKQGAARAE